jgi:hypothetical protein
MTESDPESLPPHRRYIIVVHGMGEARQNETLINVINRFAQARRGNSSASVDGVLTLGRSFGNEAYSDYALNAPKPPKSAKGQNHRWVEFEGIPQSPGVPVTDPFLGIPNKNVKNLNLRFVDLHWGDLLADDYPHVGQDPVIWADGLLARLYQRKVSDPSTVPEWTLQVLEKVRETVTLAHVYARLKAKDLDNLVFGKYMGDVQVYAEYAQSRGKAVARFHQVIREIEADHDDKERLPRYTIIAHSLGSVMSLDALMFAHAKALILGGVPSGRNLPFPGYVVPEGTPEGEHPTDWVTRVDSFVTLGSPIDKFLFIWWLNYAYLKEDAWLEPSLLRDDQKILSFNFCDEQDPVGHCLELARSQVAFKKVFSEGQDEPSVRYAIPGLAHIEYWKDQDLFSWILERAVDYPEEKPRNPSKEPAWFDLGIYREALRISYGLIPWGLILVLSFLLTWALFAGSWHGVAVLSLAGFAVGEGGRYLTSLVIWWRQLLRNKVNEPEKEGVTWGQVSSDLASHAKNVTYWATSALSLPLVKLVSPQTPWSELVQSRDLKLEKSLKDREEIRKRVWIWAWGYLSLGLAAISAGTWLDRAFRFSPRDDVSLTRLGVILGILFGSSILWRLFVRPPRARAASNAEGGKSEEGELPLSSDTRARRKAVDRVVLFRLLGGIGAGWYVSAGAQLPEKLEALMERWSTHGVLGSVLMDNWRYIFPCMAATSVVLAFVMTFRLVCFQWVQKSISSESHQ